MTLRVEFTREDLRRVRFADAADPMWELVFSLFLARSAVGRPGRERRGWSAVVQHAIEQLHSVLPGTGKDPDVDMAALPVARAGCAAPVCPGRRGAFPDCVPGWMCGPAAAERGAAGELLAAYGVLLVPDQVRAVEPVGRRGAVAALARVPGVLGWEGDALLVEYPGDRTVHLNGRGLTLLPAACCGGNPVTWTEPPPEQVAPADHLVALLGRTRAECLRQLGTPCTTTVLAARMATTVGVASRQAAVLCEAGLIRSSRRGPAVVHRITPLGSALLAGPD